jgi:Dolichyl-phosphate-mannose-protein mannosyltransferase
MRSRFLWLACLVLLSAAGVALELYLTRDGLAVRGDSVRYVMGARNLLDGNGFSRLSGGGEVFPETGFAPLLSFFLAGLGLLRIDMYAGARVLNSVLFGGSLFLIGTMIATASRSHLVGLLGAVAALTAPNVVEWHAWLMSEALFIFLMLLALHFLIVHLQAGRTAPLLVSALAAGMAGLARYVGVSLIPAGALGILLWGTGPRKDRFVRALVFSCVALAPFALWMARNQWVGGAGLANRAFRFHALRPEMLRVFLFEPTSWIIPASVVLHRIVRGALALLVLLGGPTVVLFQHLRGRPGTEGPGRLPWVLMLLVPSYLGVLVVNSLFLDAGTTQSGILRYLTPLFVLMLMLELTTYAWVCRHSRVRAMASGLAIAALAVLVVLNTKETATLAQRPFSERGFAGSLPEWKELISTLSATDAPIMTDNPEMVYYLVDRPAYMIPIKFDLYQQEFRADYLDQIDLARDRLEQGSVLVVFGAPSEEEAETIQRLGATELHIYPDAVVYGLES